MKLRKFFFTLLAAALFICVSPRMSAYAANYRVYSGDTVFLGTLIPSGTLYSGSPGDTLTIESGATLAIDIVDTLTIESGASVTNSGLINNDGTIINSGTMSNASGAELRNNGNGRIDNNTVTIATNAGAVTTNNGTITTNTGTVTTNNGTITTNTGTVTNNTNTGFIDNNYGEVTNNATWVQNNQAGGVVVNNTGNVPGNWGEVTNNFYIVTTNYLQGAVVNNYISVSNSIAVNGGTVNNSYYEVTVRNGDHTTNNLTAANSKLWLNIPGSAAFSPQPGYKITNAVSGNSDAAFTNNNGVWTLTYTRAIYYPPAYTTIPVTLTVEESPVSSVPHTGSDRQTPLMLSLALLSGAVLLSGVISRKKRA